MDSQCAAIMKEFEEEVDSVIMTMAAGSNISTGVLEKSSSLGEESHSHSQFEKQAPSRQAFLEEENQTLAAQLASCQVDISILQQRNADQLHQTGLLKTKMMEYLKTSLDKVKASESLDKELLREELRSAQGKILELETVIDDARKDADVKVAELKGKDMLIQDLSSKVGSLEQSFEEKSREVDQLKEELAREKLIGERKRMEMEERIRNKLKDVFFAAADELGNQLGTEVEEIEEEDDSVNSATINSAQGLTTPPVGDDRSSGSDGGTGTVTQVNPVGSVSTGMGTVDENAFGGTSSDLLSSDNPPRVYNLRKRESADNGTQIGLKLNGNQELVGEFGGKKRKSKKTETVRPKKVAIRQYPELGDGHVPTEEEVEVKKVHTSQPPKSGPSHQHQQAPPAPEESSAVASSSKSAPAATPAASNPEASQSPPLQHGLDDKLPLKFIACLCGEEFGDWQDLRDHISMFM